MNTVLMGVELLNRSGGVWIVTCPICENGLEFGTRAEADEEITRIRAAVRRLRSKR